MNLSVAGIFDTIKILSQSLGFAAMQTPVQTNANI